MDEKKQKLQSLFSSHGGRLSVLRDMAESDLATFEKFVDVPYREAKAEFAKLYNEYMNRDQKAVVADLPADEPPAATE